MKKMQIRMQLRVSFRRFLYRSSRGAFAQQGTITGMR